MADTRATLSFASIRLASSWGPCVSLQVGPPATAAGSGTMPSSPPGDDCPESPSANDLASAATTGAEETIRLAPAPAKVGDAASSGMLTKPAPTHAAQVSLGAEPTTSEPVQGEEMMCMLLDGGMLYQPDVRSAVFDALPLPDLLRLGATRRILRGWVVHEMPSRDVRPADVAAGCHVEVLQRLVQTHNHTNTLFRVPRGVPRMRRSLLLAAGDYSLTRPLILRDMDLRAAPGHSAGRG